MHKALFKVKLFFQKLGLFFFFFFFFSYHKTNVNCNFIAIIVMFETDFFFFPLKVFLWLRLLLSSIFYKNKILEIFVNVTTDQTVLGN
ncbi:hypothetical protein BY996DRAFT_7849363 [Phakopsora pachyrhizi]|nr:hypothetical protein BY996DRAFT_7849363 [Phakopsora pachyrhizi]